MGCDMKREGGQIELDAWGFFDPFGLIRDFGVALDQALEREPPALHLETPKHPGYSPLPDPLTLRMYLHLGATQYEGPYWTISLADVFNYEFGNHAFRNGMVKDDAALNPKQIVASLRALADQLEARIETPSIP